MEQNNNGKLQSGDIVIPKSRLTLFLENAWYHYKWHIIILAFFVAVFGVCVAQCATADHPDVIATYAGGYTLSGSEINSFNQIFTGLLSNEKEDEQTLVSFNHYSIYTEDELRNQYYGETEELNGAASLAYNSAKQTNANHITQFSSFLMTGESAVLLVSEWVYETRILPERMMTLESVLGYTPDSAVDAYAIRLCDTALYQQYEVLQVLPEDTLVVLAQPTFAGQTSKEEVYALHKALFCAIVEYQP